MLATSIYSECDSDRFLYVSDCNPQIAFISLVRKLINQCIDVITIHMIY